MAPIIKYLAHNRKTSAEVPCNSPWRAAAGVCSPAPSILPSGTANALRLECKMNNYPATAWAAPSNQGVDDFHTATASEPVCTIGELARRFDLTHRALRFYESRGLLNPVRRGSTRVYRVKEVERLAFIVKAKKLGLTLTAIGQILRDADSGQTLRFDRETCLAQIAVLERKLAQTREALAELRTICSVCDDHRPDRR